MYGNLVRTMHSTAKHGFFLRLQSCDDLSSLYFNFCTPGSSGIGILNECYPALRGFDIFTRFVVLAKVSISSGVLLFGLD